MKKIILLTCFSGMLFGQIPAGYYSGTENLSGYALKAKLHSIISKNTVSWNYDDLKTLAKQTDADNFYDKDGSLLDMYTKFPQGGSTVKYYDDTQLISSSSKEGLGWNREHVMPQSTFYSDYPMYSDIFYIFPADAYINQRRSNNPYAAVGTATYTFSNGTKIGASVTPGKTGTVLEPINEFKGDIARMLLYFVVRYEGKLNFFTWATAPSPLLGSEEAGYQQWYINQLLTWAANDPVSPAELARNETVYKLQQNRNPFIDHPEWVPAIWGSAKNTALPPLRRTSRFPIKARTFCARSGTRFPELWAINYY